MGLPILLDRNQTVRSILRLVDNSTISEKHAVKLLREIYGGEKVDDGKTEEKKATTERPNKIKEMILWVKDRRRTLDEDLNQMRAVQSAPFTPPEMKRNLALAITHLEDSRMRLGQVLADLNAEYPYLNGNDPTTDKIDPPADTAKG